MLPAITALSDADQALRQALSEIGDQEVPPDVHTAVARARQATIRARDQLERHERLRQHQEAANVRRIR